jgi:anaerobic selenocysteine-containing dehydrogenase
VLSGAQPVVSPMYHTRSTMDVLIAAAQAAGGKYAEAVPFQDEVEYIRGKLASLVDQVDGSFFAPEINTFAAYFQQHGGWWKNTPEFIAPSSSAFNKAMRLESPESLHEHEFYFMPFVSPTLAEAGANKPWLQELPDPTTTVMWNSWVEINPETAHELGVTNDDVIEIVSEAGVVKAAVYLYPAIHPRVIAMPFGQGHTAYGRYATTIGFGEKFMNLVPTSKQAEGVKASPRGANPADVLGAQFNEAGDLAYAGMKVEIKKTPDTQILSRLESRIGVYGEGMGEGH